MRSLPRSRSARLRRFGLSVVLVAACAATLINCVTVATVDEFHLASLLHDDGYYYLLIAENISDGKGITFDGVHPTSGFQPLYQGVSIGIVFFSRLARISVFRGIFFLNLALVCLAALAIGRAFSRMRAGLEPRRAYLWAALILPLNFPLVFKRLGAGMEMSLALLLLSLLFQAFCAEESDGGHAWRRFREGLLLGALTLTRMDYAVFLPVFAAFVAMQSHGRGWRHLIPVALGYAIPVGAYLLFQHAAFDAIVPVSFLAKHHSSALQAAALTPAGRLGAFAQNLAGMWLYPLGYAFFGYFWRWKTPGLAAAGMMVASTCVFMMWAGRNRIGAILARPGVAWFFAAALAHGVLFSWSGVGFIGPAYFWYYTPELLLIVLSLVMLATAVPGGARPLRHLPALLLSLILLSSTLLYDIDRDIASYAPYRRAIEVAQELVPPTAVVGSWDAGYNAYWLRPRRVINLDGMVNSREYLERVLKGGDFPRYFFEQGISFLMNMAPATQGERDRISSSFFHHPSIPRACYDILAAVPFLRQNLDIYLLQYHCAAGERS